MLFDLPLHSRCFSWPTSTRPGSLDGLPGDRDLPPREGLVNSKLKNYEVLTGSICHLVVGGVLILVVKDAP